VKKTRGTDQWAYRCDAPGTDVAVTTELLRDGFLWRSLHNADGHKIANLKNMEVGDTVHVFVVEGGVERYLSSHLLVRPHDLADPDVPAINAGRDGALFDQLIEAGYALDPVLGCFTGFRVRRDDYPTVPDRRPRWIGRNAMTHITR